MTFLAAFTSAFPRSVGRISAARRSWGSRIPVTGRAELHDEVVHREQLWLTREPDLLEHGPDYLAEPLEGLG